MHTEAIHHYSNIAAVVALDGLVERVRLGLSPKEIANIVQVIFHLKPNQITSYFQAISADPNEDTNMSDISRNNGNLIACRAGGLFGVAAAGLVWCDSLVIPIPDGMDVATDISYVVGVATNSTDIMHGVSVYFKRRKERPGEREALIMSRR